MSPPRFFAPEIRPGIVLELSPEEAHHARDVLRLKTGERIRLLDGKGREFEAELVEVSRRRVRVRPLELSREEPEPANRAEFLIPLLKGGRTEFLVEKATELGIFRILPFVSRRTVVREASRVRERLLKRAVQALKQCGRLQLPRIEPPAPLEEVLPGVRASRRLFAYEKGGQPLTRAFSGPFAEVALATGPEGGFAEEEAEAFLNYGFTPVSLGPYILRAETAALFLMSVWRYHSLSDHHTRG